MSGQLNDETLPSGAKNPGISPEEVAEIVKKASEPVTDKPSDLRGLLIKKLEELINRIMSEVEFPHSMTLLQLAMEVTNINARYKARKDEIRVQELEGGGDKGWAIYDATDRLVCVSPFSESQALVDVAAQEGIDPPGIDGGIELDADKLSEILKSRGFTECEVVVIKKGGA